MEINSNFIKCFNENKTKEKYKEVINSNFIDFTNCRICNETVYYYDSTFKLNKVTKNIEVRNKSYLSFKCLLGKKYFLSCCEECLINKYPEYESKNKSRVFNRMSYLTEYAFNIPHDEVLIWMKDNYGITERNLIKKYGVEIGKKNWKIYCDKQAFSNSFECKKEKYGWNKTQFDSYNASRSVTLNNLIYKHGEEKGLIVWNKYCDRQRYTTTINYFVEKHGLERGTEIYENFCKKRMFEFGYSDISQKLFMQLDKYFDNTFYACKDGEIKYDYENTCFYLDFYIKDKNIGIEFNGDIWHANPSLYKDDDKPNPYLIDLTAKEIWEKDKIKNDFLKTKLYKLIIIWETDLNKYGMDEIIEKTLKEINE